MKKITRSNFEEIYPEFVAALNNASYIAVDMEFTGIDRTTTTDFLRSPEDALEDKIAAARRFSVVQIGFSIFQGDEVKSCNNLTSAQGPRQPESVPFSHKELMLEELRAFRPQHSANQGLVEMLERMATTERVNPQDISTMEGIRNGVRQHFARTRASSVYDNLCVCDALDEVDRAIALASDWMRRLGSSKRQLWAKSYAFYLFPASWRGDLDPELVLSARTMEFLRTNQMDLNSWISEGLLFVPFEEYTRARRLDCVAAEFSDPKKEMDAQLDALRKWMKSLSCEEGGNQLLNEYNQIENFARKAEVHETVELRLPRLNTGNTSRFNSLMRSLGLRVVKHLMVKVPDDGLTVETSFRDPRYFGTRLLAALVGATRERRKPLIIHNGLSDLAFLCCLMHKEPPDSITQFKQLVRNMFPVFYDTRTLTCAPSLQRIGNLTGPLIKTYTTLSELNRSVNIYHGMCRRASEETVKEHDAAWDAFMTGSLFAFAQEELRQVKADYRRLACITPVHGCIFSIDFKDDQENCLVQPRSVAAYLFHRTENRSFCTDSLRDDLRKHGMCISFLYSGDDCLAIVSNAAVSESVLREVENVVRSWTDKWGFSLTVLDVEEKIDRYHIKYVSEM